MSESTIDPLEFCAQHGPTSDPCEYTDLFADLPAQVPSLVGIVQGLLVHPLCVALYHA